MQCNHIIITIIIITIITMLLFVNIMFIIYHIFLLVSTDDESCMLKLSKVEKTMECLMDDVIAEGMGCCLDRGGLPPPTNKYAERLQMYLNGVETNTRQNESSSEPGMYSKPPRTRMP